MGLFHRFKKKETESKGFDWPELTFQKEGEPVVMGFALLKEKELDMETLLPLLREEFGADADLKIEQKEGKVPSLVAELGGITFLCTHMPFPVPNGEVHEQVERNLLDPETAEAARHHQSFLIVNTLNREQEKRIEHALWFNRLCGVLMGLPTAAAMYMGGAGLLIAPERYRRQVALLKKSREQGERFFPTQLWIRVCFVEEGGRKLAATRGMGDFGFYDLCFYDTKQEPQTLYEWLHLMCTQELTGETRFRNREPVRFGEGLEGVLKLEGDALCIIGV